MTNEEICTKFMREFYSDGKLAQLLAHAEDGKLVHRSCCCFIGIPNANHPLQGYFGNSTYNANHYLAVTDIPFYKTAEIAFLRLGNKNGDESRRAAIIPLIRAEMARRDLLKAQPSNPDQPVLELMHFSGCNEDGDGSGE